MTITPLPLPPSWLVLTYISLELDASPVGWSSPAPSEPAREVGLALWTRALGPRLMTGGTRANVDYLAARLHGRRSLLGVAALLAVAPPPAGPSTPPPACRVNLAVVGAAAVAGRLVTYGLGVGLAGAAADEIADRLRDWVAPWTVALGLLGVVAVLWLLVRIDWRAAIERRLRFRRAPPRARRRQRETLARRRRRAGRAAVATRAMNRSPVPATPDGLHVMTAADMGPLRRYTIPVVPDLVGVPGLVGHGHAGGQPGDELGGVADVEQPGEQLGAGGGRPDPDARDAAAADRAAVHGDHQAGELVGRADEVRVERGAPGRLDRKWPARVLDDEGAAHERTAEAEVPQGLRHLRGPASPDPRAPPAPSSPRGRPSR